MPYEQGIEVINKAAQKHDEDLMWQMWLSVYPNMDEKSFVPFSKFRQGLLNNKPATSSETTEELISKAEKIKAIDQQKAVM
jgi:hypothetical protein